MLDLSAKRKLRPRSKQRHESSMSSRGRLLAMTLSCDEYASIPIGNVSFQLEPEVLDPH